jgi:hypothetical protein
MPLGRGIAAGLLAARDHSPVGLRQPRSRADDESTRDRQNGSCEQADASAAARNSAEGVREDQTEEEAPRLPAPGEEAIRTEEASQEDQRDVAQGTPLMLACAHRSVRVPLLGMLLAGVLLAGLASVAASTAFAAGAWWRLSSAAAPTNLQPASESQLVVSATDFGYEEVKASAAHPIEIVDHLPAGLEVGAEGVRAKFLSNPISCPQHSGQLVVCELPSAVPAYEGVELKIAVKVTAAEGSTLENEATVEGGEGAIAGQTLSKAVRVASAKPAFGVEKYELTPEDAEGKPDTQAGSHPFQLTTTFDLDTALEYNHHSEHLEATAPVLPRNLHFVLPPGLLGNPKLTVTPQCSSVDFATIAYDATNLCKSETAVGVARVTINEPNVFGGVITETVPVFNLVPAPGEPARFGLEVDKVPVVFNTAVRTGKDYAVEVSVENASQAAALLETQVTFWGVPGEEIHDSSRGWECIGGGHYDRGAEPAKPCQPLGRTEPPAFLTLPTSCAATPTTSVQGESWPQGPHNDVVSTLAASYRFPAALENCDLLAFSPSIAVEPETHAASTPTGLTVTVKVPQESTVAGNGLAESDVNATTVALPEGVLASPAAANGLAACLASGIGLEGQLLGSSQLEDEQLENDHFSSLAGTCPGESKIGTVKIETPLLEHELTGGIYLAEQDTNLSEQKLVLYLVAEDPVSGVRVKLAGDVHVDPSTGQLTSTFQNTPPEPFEELTLSFFGGAGASQSTPAQCGTYTTQAAFDPWSGTSAVGVSSSFEVTSGPERGGCSDPQPFAPSFQAGSLDDEAGAFTQFSLTIGHPDADQWLGGLTMHLPPGVAALLSTVTPCAEPPAGREWACGPESLIGHSSASSGLGGSPYTLAGNVYLTVGYDNAPFGLLVVTPANAGPFHLGDVDVRSRIDVDPTTAAVTVTSDPFPTYVKGVPVQLKQIDVTVDREGFELNPTNCQQTAIAATLTSSGGASEPVSSPFQVGDCAKLPFAPKLTASTGAQASKANGAALDVKVTSAGLGQANIAKVDLQLPIALPSRLSTIQKACPEAVFVANPAGCDEGSNIGYATIHTPVLKSPLTGPAYLVSHGGAAFPDVEFVLQGEGILLILDGKTDIEKGITYSRFEATPDAPFTSFETFLPTGPHSALTAYVPASHNFNLCGTPLAMPTEITGQNGAVIRQTTNIAVNGCATVHPLTSSKLLARALKTCKQDKNKRKRLACERLARKRYGKKAKHRK